MTGTKRAGEHGDASVTLETDIVQPKAPDGGWGWFVVLGCFGLRAIVGKLFHMPLKFMITTVLYGM